MPKAIEPHRIELASYPFCWTVDPAFGDMDIAGHINNVALYRYYETGRTRWLLELTGDDHYFSKGRANVLVAESTVRFTGEVNFPEPVIVATGIGRIGNSSFSSMQALFQNGRCVGLSDAVMVMAVDGRPEPIEDKLRQRMDAYLVSTPKR